MPSRDRVLFVCYANVCRSPLAEGVLRHHVDARGLTHRVAIESAGVSALVGAPPHPLSVEVARRRGVTLAGASRQLRRADLFRFQHVVVLDRFVLAEIHRLCGLTPKSPPLAHDPRERLRLLRQIADPHADGDALDVPDPIQRGIDAYERAYRLIDEACRALLDELEG
ncbi:MAG: low molecular weight phosphotyrosine protein phosphatase [Myxococcales bacterium]|nr:low molecular weight phosphotyrosine protein phosphatase [Myxococcales bacterium]